MATGKYVLLCEHVHLRSDRQCEHLHPRWSHCKQVRQHWRHEEEGDTNAPCAVNLWKKFSLIYFHIFL